MALMLFEEARLTEDAIRYGFAVGKARALERRSLDAAAFERLLDAAGFPEQKRLLSDTPYGRFLENASSPAEVEQALDDALTASYRFLREAALPEAVVCYFRVRDDFANLKAAVKARLVSTSVEGMLVHHGSIDCERFKGDLAELPDPFGPLATELLREGARAEDADAGAAADLAAVDRAVDAAMFARLLELSDEAHSSFLRDVTVMAIDLANVKIIVRSRFANRGAKWTALQFIEGGSISHIELVRLAALGAENFAVAVPRMPSLRSIPTALLGDAATLDVAIDTVTQAAHQRAKRGPIGPEPVIAFVFGRESEVAALRALLLGTLSNVDREALRLRVRPGL